MVFQDRILLCSTGYTETFYIDQADFELRVSPASASQVPVLKVYNHARMLLMNTELLLISCDL